MEAEIEDRLRDLKTDLEDKIERVESHLALAIRGVDDRLNQEESDRERADTSLHDEISRVERSV